MDPDFWHQRWRDNRIGFHQDRVTPWLEKYWPTLGLSPGSHVFVPLAGKSLDLAWLASKGHRVLGVELSQLAIEQFFAEHDLAPEAQQSRYGTHFRACGIELICGDVFDLDAAALADCMAVFDRAALIALPPELRQRYVGDVHATLPPGCRGLLITLEYPQHEKSGPPFSVPEQEVRAVYGRDWTITTLERQDILALQPGFAAEGVSALQAVAYKLERKQRSLAQAVPYSRMAADGR